jgi:hypothetical protein
MMGLVIGVLLSRPLHAIDVTAPPGQRPWPKREGSGGFSGADARKA